MKFSVAAVIGAAAAVQAWGGNVSYTTEVVTALTTYCPYSTTIENNGVTYTVTEATTLTITNCPCTVTKPVTTYSSSAASNSTIAPPAPPPASTTVLVSPASTSSVAVLPTAGAGKAAALSGAGLAGVLGLAAFAL